MLKTKFQKLVMAIPLRPGIALVFAFLVGYLSLFLPFGYLDVTYTENGIVSNLTLPVYGEVSSFLEINYCTVSKVEWLTEINWFFKVSWPNIMVIWLVMIVLRYLQKYLPATRRRLVIFTIACVFFAFTPIVILELLTANFVDCLKSMEAVVHSISIDWFTISTWIFSLLLGLYALTKRETIKEQELSSMTK